MGYRFLADYDPQKEQKKKKQQNGALSAPRSGQSLKPLATAGNSATPAETKPRVTRGSALGGSAVTPVQLPKQLIVPKLTKVSTPAQKTTQTQAPKQLKLPTIQAFGAGDYTRAGKTMERVAKTVKAGATSAAAGFTEIAGQFHPTTGQQSLGQFSGFGDMGRAVRDNRTKGTDINESIRRQEQQRRIRQKQSQRSIFDAATRLTEKGQQYEQEAKEGLGTVGQFLVDMGVTGTQMAGDAMANLILPGSGLAIMGMRSYGQAAGEARRQGKNEQQQFLAGLKSAGIEVFTEKMFGAFSKIYGGAAADDVVEKLVSKLTKNTTGQALLTWIINGVGEGVEEVTSDLLNPLADRLLRLDDGKGRIYSADDLAQWGYDFLLGAAMGIVGGGTQLAQGIRQGRAQTAEGDYYADLQRNGLSSADAAANARRASDAMGRLLPKTDGLRMPQLTTYAERQAAEYRGEKPQNVNDPRIGRLELSSEKYNPSGADVSTVYGNRYRQQVKEDAIRRLGITDGKPAYLVASNITKNGQEYYVDVTKASLNKLLFTKNHEPLELERLLLVDNLEKAIDGSYWAESNGDRKGRTQIDGFDTLRTSFYIDGIPYYADIKVKVVDKGAGQNPQNVAYYIEPEEITSIKKADTQSPTEGRHAPHIFFRDGVSAYTTSVPQSRTGVNIQGMQSGGQYASGPAAPLQMPRLTTYEERAAADRQAGEADRVTRLIEQIDTLNAEVGRESVPVSETVQGEADRSDYLDALARDENMFTSDAYTLADQLYDLQLRRVQQQEAPPERPAEQVAREDLDEIAELFTDQGNFFTSREDRIRDTENMVTDHTIEVGKTGKEKAAEAWSYFYRKMVDAGHSVDKFAKAAGDPYLYQIYNQARASGSAGVSMITDAQTNINAEKVGESLNGIFSPIRAKGEDYYHAFQMYLFDLHNIDRMSLSQNKEAAVLEATTALNEFDANHPEMRTSTEAQLARMTESLDPDVAELAREKMRLLQNINRADAIKDKPVFSFDVTADVSRERARQMLEQHPEFEEYRQQVRGYIDNLMQYRVDSGLMTQADADYLKRLYPNYVPTMRVGAEQAGAGRDRNAVRIGKTVGRAEGGTANLVPLHEALGRQTMKVVREGSKNRFGQRLLDDFTRVGENSPAAHYVQEAHEYEYDFAPDTLDDMSREQLTKDKTLTVFKDGKLWELTVDDTMFDALKALSPDAAESNALTRVVRTANNLFKALVTGYNPTFTIRNTVRDLQTAGLYTRDALAFARNYPKALAEIKNNGQYWQMYKALGGSFSSVFDYNTGTVKEPKGRTAKLMAKIEALNMTMEQAPRLAEFMGVVEKGGISQENLADALYAAADVTVNFGRAGTLGKVLNANYVPFLNPGIQGFDKLVRRVTETKGGKEWSKLIVRAAALGVAPALLNSLLYHDDEEWDDLRDSDKDTNYMFKLKDGIWLKIPKGRELSLLGITADRVSDAVQGQDVDLIATLNTMGNQVAPANPLTSNIASALFEAQLFDPSSPGRTWYGGDIENQRLQSYAPGQRYDSSTDVFSKAVGGALGISPKKLNYVLDQYSGVVGDFLLPLLTPQAERGMFAKAFTVDAVTSNRLSGDFYDEADALTYAKNGGDAAAGVVSRFWSKQQSACSDLYKQIREVEASDLSDREKRQKTRELKALVNGIQKNAMAVEDTYRAAVEKSLRRGMDADDAYRTANKDCFGAEYALQVYNKDVYEKAKNARSNGVSYDDYYTYYFGTKGFKATDDTSVTTQKFDWLQSSGMDITSQAEIYFADMASDKALETQVQLEISSGITAEQFYQYKVASNGMTKKAEKLQAINSMSLTYAQKDAIYYAEGWAQSTIGQAPWHGGYGGYFGGGHSSGDSSEVTRMLANIRRLRGADDGGYTVGSDPTVSEMLASIRRLSGEQSYSSGGNLTVSEMLENVRRKRAAMGQ